MRGFSSFPISVSLVSLFDELFSNKKRAGIRGEKSPRIVRVLRR
jgi:hypothetical protein